MQQLKNLIAFASDNCYVISAMKEVTRQIDYLRSAERLLYRPHIHLLLVILFGIISYSNSINVPLQFDDRSYILENPLIRNLDYYISPSQAEQYNNSVYADFYHFFKTRFVGYLSFAINYSLSGFDVRGYHIFNLVVHVTNAILVYHLLSITLSLSVDYHVRGSSNVGSLIAFSAAVLFVVHPVETQAVTYITQRFTSLAALFYLLSLYLYVSARKAAGAATRIAESRHTKKSIVLYGGSIIVALLAMKTKEIAFTLPLLIALYDLLFFRDSPPKRLLFLLPYFLTMLIIPLTVVSISQPVGQILGEIGAATTSHTFLPRLDYLATEMRVVATYIRLIFMPVSQNLDYDYPIFHSFLNYSVLLSVILLGGLLLGAICILRRPSKMIHTNELRVISFGVFWFFITLSVESSIIPIEDVIFEHRLYLPSIGLFMSFSSLLLLLINMPVNLRATSGIRVFVAVAALAVPLSYMTYERNKVWQDPIALWEDVTAKSPNKPRGFNNLGFYLYKEGRFGEALAAFSKVLSLNPNYPNGYCNVGAVYLAGGDVEGAIQYFKRAIELKPNDGLFHYNLGKAYLVKNWPAAAQEEFVIACSQGSDKACSELRNDKK